MMTTSRRRTLAFLLALVCAAGAGATLTAGQSDKPVKKIEGGRLDEIELYVAALPGPGDRTVVVHPFVTASANLGTGNKEGDADEQDEAKKMQDEAPKLMGAALVEALKTGGAFKAIAAGESDAPSASVLTVEGTFTELDPGSRAKRYFVGFGAGKAKVAISGTVKDGDGKVLATFKQRRIATMGWAGGDSIKKMTGDCRQLGEDIAKFLTTWAKGGKLD